jgi:hypothetical protein
MLPILLATQPQPQEDSPGWRWELFWRQTGEWLQNILSDSDERSSGGFQWPDWILDSVRFIVLFLVILLIFRLGYRLYSKWYPQWRKRWQQKEEVPAIDSIEPAAKYTLSQWLTIAQEEAAAGNYANACRALYMAALRRLHEAEVIGDLSSRTDREYLTALGKFPQLGTSRFLFLTHEKICFGNSAISGETFELCDRAYREIDREFPPQILER